jgi:hypothetical protein
MLRALLRVWSVGSKKQTAESREQIEGRQQTEESIKVWHLCCDLRSLPLARVLSRHQGRNHSIVTPQGPHIRNELRLQFACGHTQKLQANRHRHIVGETACGNVVIPSMCITEV